VNDDLYRAFLRSMAEGVKNEPEAEDELLEAARRVQVRKASILEGRDFAPEGERGERDPSQGARLLFSGLDVDLPVLRVVAEHFGQAIVENELATSVLRGEDFAAIELGSLGAMGFVEGVLTGLMLSQVRRERERS
jgi:hypothetical protein